MKYRGLHDDLSRGPVPTLDFPEEAHPHPRHLQGQPLLAPTFEHTMQYNRPPPHGAPRREPSPRPRPASSSPTPAQYHVTIVPEQEAFGHLHYLLNWEQYTPLAETPHGHVLAPAQPDAQKLTHDMFEELARHLPQAPCCHLGAG